MYDSCSKKGFTRKETKGKKRTLWHYNAIKVKRKFTL
jgi:hypothetical protein